MPCGQLLRRISDYVAEDAGRALQRQGSRGGTLKERIKALGTKIVIPADLLEGLDDLRLLGNDAAHIESQEYEKVGKEEVEIGIEFAKEVPKAVYQYSALLNRLRALKKTEDFPPNSPTR